MMQNFDAAFIRIMACRERKPQLRRRREIFVIAHLTLWIPRRDSDRISSVLGASGHRRDYLRNFAGAWLGDFGGTVSTGALTDHVAGQNEQSSKHGQKERLRGSPD